MSCAFCNIVLGTASAIIVREWPDALAIVPLNPVTDGHLLIIPKAHVTDACEDPVVTGAVMQRAVELPDRPCNLITSVGRAATQSVFHLHIHVVPRQFGDGLALPWSGQKEERS